MGLKIVFKSVKSTFKLTLNDDKGIVANDYKHEKNSFNHFRIIFELGINTNIYSHEQFIGCLEFDLKGENGEEKTSFLNDFRKDWCVFLRV